MPLSNQIRILALTLLTVFLFAGSAPAQSDHVTARLLLNTDALTPGQQAIAAVVVDVEEGYHAQSSQPLDKYLIPFVVKLTSESALAIDLPLYPRGELIEIPALGGQLSVYEGQVITFIPFIVPEDAAPGEVTISASVRLQICDDTTCDPPVRLKLSQTTRVVAKGSRVQSFHSETFRQFDPMRWLNKHEDASTQPGLDTTADPGAKWIPYSDETLAQLRSHGDPVIVKFTAAWCVNCHVVERRVFGDPATLEALLKRGAKLVKVDLTEQGAPGSDLLAKLNPSGAIPLTAIYFPGDEEPALISGIYASSDLIASLDDAGKTRQSLTSVMGFELKDRSIFVTLGVAFLVGIVLNIVPCVLPVLPIKAIGFYEAAQHSRSRSVLYGGVFSLGIIAAFAALAIAVPLFGLKWGEWISNPWFAGTLSFVLLLAAAQAFGLLEFVLPSSLNRFDASHDTIAGNFAWGLMTAVLSTPCTIGMFAAVITVALSLGTLLGTLVLVVVGAGMASPYFLLSAFPEAARRFPRTGPWPDVVKQMTGFILIAIALFFVQPVLPAAMRGNLVWWLIFACVAASAVFLLARTLQISPRPRPIAVSSLISAMLVAAGLYVTFLLIA